MIISLTYDYNDSLLDVALISQEAGISRTYSVSHKGERIGFLIKEARTGKYSVGVDHDHIEPTIGKNVEGAIIDLCECLDREVARRIWPND